MPRSLIRTLLLAACTALSLQGTAHAAAADELKRFVEGVQTLSARFSQVQKDERGEVLSSTSGQMWLARPDRFRWEYRQPYRQLMVCDGDRIWHFDPDLAQVTVRSAREALQGTPAALLSQGRALSEQFLVADAGMDAGASIVRLTPKSADSDFRSIELWLEAGMPRRMRFHDQLGGMTEIGFSEVAAGGKAAPELFRFEVPKDVEVVETGVP